MFHAGAGAVRQHITRPRLRGRQQQTGDPLCVVDAYGHRLQAAGSYCAVFGFHSPSAAPVGSMMMLIQPAPGTSVTSSMILAPSDFAFCVEAAISSTST